MRLVDNFRAFLLSALPSALVLLSSALSTAGVYQWTNSTSGFYSDPLNWMVLSAGGTPPPLTNDIAVFDAPGSFEVLFLNEPTNASMTMEGDSIVFRPVGTNRKYTLISNAEITGGSLTLGASGLALNLDVGDTLTVYAGGTLTVTNHSVINASHLDVAASVLLPGEGVLYVDGVGTQMHITGTGPHAVGDDLNGVLAFRNGAIGSFAGQLNLGASSYEEEFGQGTLYINSASQVTTTDVIIGGGLNREGEFFLNGLGSSLTQMGGAGLTIGGPIGRGNGTVNISNGAQLTTGTDGIAIHGTGSLVVEGASSALNVHGNIVIDGGNIPNRIQPSFSVSAQSAYALAAGLTFSADRYATVDLLDGPTIAQGQTYFVRGNSVLTASGGLTVGGDTEGAIDITNGYLNITHGANILTHGAIRLTSGGITANQTVRVNGGSVTLLGSTFMQGPQLALIAENNGEISFQDPVTILPGRRFEVMNDGQLNANILTVGPDSQLYVGDGGTLAVQAIDFARTGQFPIVSGGRLEMDAFFGSLNMPAGTLAPGREFPTALSIIGNFQQQSSGTLEIEIGGTVGGQEYDQLSMSGSGILDGDLEIKFIDLGNGLFAPESGDLFEIVLAGSGLAGKFDQVIMPELDPDLAWELQYHANNLVLEFFTLPPGDFNMDGHVDAVDFAAWHDGFGTTAGATRADGDADGDADVDGNDFLLWQQNLNMGTSSIGCQTAVPEPNTVGLGLILILISGLALRGLRVQSS